MGWLESVLFLVCGLALLWTGLRMLPAGADGHMPLPYIIALQRFLWAPLAIAVCVGIYSHLWLPAILATMIIPLTLLGVLPYRRRARPASSGDAHTGTVRLATLNCRYGRADADAIVTLVRDQRIGVLALQELTPQLLDELEDAGLGQALPYRVCGRAKPDDNGGFNGLWCRREPVGTSQSSIDIMAADVPFIEYALNEGGKERVRFMSVHTKSPQRGCREWSSGVLALRALASRGRTVVLGDLNSGLDHPSFRATLRDRRRRYFVDAALEWARGSSPTYPSWLPWPRIVLDHILATPDMTFRGVSTLRVNGTDHLALLATLRY